MWAVGWSWRGNSSSRRFGFGGRAATAHIPTDVRSERWRTDGRPARGHRSSLIVFTCTQQTYAAALSPTLSQFVLPLVYIFYIYYTLLYIHLHVKRKHKRGHQHRGLWQLILVQSSRKTFCILHSSSARFCGKYRKIYALRNYRCAERTASPESRPALRHRRLALTPP